MNRVDILTRPSTSRPVGVIATAPDNRLDSVSSKVKPCHLARKAIVYIRQSTVQQVLNNRESTDRQYALDQRAVQLGWPAECVVIVDEDQGLSGQTAAGRSGFAYLLSQVALNQVGIILGLETSRLARSNKDWHQLLDVCGIFQTLLADQDGVYDPTNYNDRLLLGLKGTMSEAEIHLLRSRMYEGLLNKARRGEVYSHAPIGYVKSPQGGGLALDPDEQVQSVVRLIFEQFERQGTVCALLRYLVRSEILIPVRPHQKQYRGQLQWHRPCRTTLQNMLHHPIYAGYYRFGHRSVDPRKKVPGKRQSGRMFRAAKDCPVLLPDRCPAYISKEQFQANQVRLNDNRARVECLGAPGRGPALLSGLLACGRCGYRMVVNYAKWGLRYNCYHALVHFGEPECQSLSGQRLDALVADQVLAALQPAALELHLAAAEDVERQRQMLHRNWEQKLERSRYDAERAARQYGEVEPENRLVARELERRWEEALHEEVRLKQEYEQFCAERPAKLTAAQREQIRQLAQDIPKIWSAETTTAVDRQRLIRMLIERVVVEVQGQSEQVKVAITWSGGSVSQHELVRTVGSYAQLVNYPRLCARIEELRSQGKSMEEVAACLNAEGFRPPKQVDRFTGGMVSGFMARMYEKAGKSYSRQVAGALKKGEWLLGDLARHLGMSQATLHHWRKAGWVRARKMVVSGGLWAIWATGKERKRLSRLRRHQLTKLNQEIPEDLKTPEMRTPEMGKSKRST
jgi:DNA invertase Pin-like site-specific DNA recombinase